jgi:hypothetical protein
LYNGDTAPTDSLLQHDQPEDHPTRPTNVTAPYFVAELTGLNTRVGWPESMRLIVRRVKPTRRHLKKLTAFEKKTGWRYCITATNIRHM